MLNELLDSPATPVVTFLLGLVVGHWFAIHRDQRKEYNELVPPLRKKVASEAESPSPMATAITRHEADAIAARMNILSRLHFMKACQRYWKAKESQHQDNLGQPLHSHPDCIREAAKHLIKKIPIR